jgi:hypothetical protein
MRQRLSFREHFRRGNAPITQIAVLYAYCRSAGDTAAGQKTAAIIPIRSTEAPKNWQLWGNFSVNAADWGQLPNESAIAVGLQTRLSSELWDSHASIPPSKNRLNMLRFLRASAAASCL